MMITVQVSLLRIRMSCVIVSWHTLLLYSILLPPRGSAAFPTHLVNCLVGTYGQDDGGLWCQVLVMSGVHTSWLRLCKLQINSCLEAANGDVEVNPKWKLQRFFASTNPAACQQSFEMPSESEHTQSGSITSGDDQNIGPSSPVDVPPTDDAHKPAAHPSSSRRSRLVPSDNPDDYKEKYERPPLTSLLTPGPGASRFRNSALKVMHLNRMQASVRAPGAEPGVDPRRPSTVEQYSNIHEECLIQVIDYGGAHASFQRATNESLIHFLEDSKTSVRPVWAKVRWINVMGISWDVISALALQYDLHPLSVEDVLHTRRTTLSKADYYVKHLFISTLCHTLGESKKHKDSDAEGPDDEPKEKNHGRKDNHHHHPLQDNGVIVDDKITSSRIPSTSRGGSSSLPPPATAENRKSKSWHWFNSKSSTPKPSKRTAHDDDNSDEDVHSPIEDIGHLFEDITMPHVAASSAQAPPPARPNPNPLKKTTASFYREKVARKEAFVNELKKDARINVEIRNLYLFLLRDGTVISIYRKDATSRMFATPIVNRLREPHTILRASADPSLLLQAILDYIVDDALRVIDCYHDKILSLERQILIKPKMMSVRQLHILSGDITLHKRTLTPLRSLVYGLRRYDLARCQALVSSAAPKSELSGVKGFMTHQAKIYLADVLDHTEYILSSLDTFSSIAENLINFTFNTISYQTNETMRRLSIATVIFFPLTFLTGYFGMNFENMWSIHHGHTDIVFWIIAIPVMVIVISSFLWHDLERMTRFIRNEADRRHFKKSFKLKQA
ncbi:uncharacterized protein EI90DRAFT_1620505 [Cantharellus anzutake]|uniref:uncharacterized protein n=1 Tax=Cantharellus anzutake TaxID=1750568 RepID=UPI001905E556|nr:uncharacterized protein EI90DRAFT_1620505 [Cantharellus anzutake]KAF8328271.1 hypothetical protein EI90DRAFT_1620505 [Cantharellus anzutake]